MGKANAYKIEHDAGCQCGCGAAFDFTQLQEFSNDELHLIDGFILPRILEVMKVEPTKKINALEMSLSAALTGEFGAQSRKSIARALRVLRREGKTGKWNQTKIDKILQPIAEAIGPLFSQRQANKLLQTTIAIYNLQKKYESDRAGIQPSFRVVDDIAKRGIAQNNIFWVGARYGNDIGPRLRAIANDILITQGLPLNDAADAMAQAMGYVIDRQPNSKMPPLSDRAEIPRGFTGTPRDYFRGVAAAIRTTSTSFASIQTFQEVGFNWYVLSNPMDSQTTRICAFLNGKVFRVSDGARVMNNYMAAATPTDAKAAMPWMSFNELGRRVGFSSEGDFDQQNLSTATIASQNIALPPFHFRCRTVAEPIGGTGKPGSVPPKPSVPPMAKPKPGAPKPKPPKPKPTKPKPKPKVVAPKPIPIKPPKPKKPKAAKETKPKYKPKKSPDISETFKPATTVKEAERRLKKVFGRISYQGHALTGWSETDKLNALNGVLYEIERARANGLYTGKKYNRLIFKNLVASDKAAGMHSWIGWTWSEDKSEIYMDASKTYGSARSWKPLTKKEERKIAEIKKRLGYDQRDTMSAGMHNMTVTMRHEIAHGVHYAADRHSGGATNTMRERAWLDLGGKSSVPLRQYVSKYCARKDSKEFFAELFVIYTSPEFVPGSLDAVLGVGIEEILEAHLFHAREYYKTSKAKGKK